VAGRLQRDKGRGNSLHKRYLPHSTERIINSGLGFSCFYLLERVADLFFLVMLRVIAVVSADKDKSSESRVNELPMAALAALDARKPSTLQSANNFGQSPSCWYVGFL
jgi:hypothetical protein